jgi:hypothetical protein
MNKTRLLRHLHGRKSKVTNDAPEKRRGACILPMVTVPITLKIMDEF